MSWHILAGLITIIVSVCTWLDWIATKKEEDRTRLSLVGWWNQLDEFKLREAVRASSAVFNRLFDSVYGNRPFSLRRMGMSAVTSMVAIGTASLVYLGSNHHPRFGDWGVLLLPFFLLINLFVDFLSLNKTRFLLQKSENASGLRLAAFLALDVLLTVILYSITLLALAQLATCNFHNASNFVLDVITGRADYMAPVFFIAAFTTSLLFYLFLASTVFFKVFDLSRSRLMVLLDRLEASDSLFKSAGILLSAILAAGKGLGEIMSAVSLGK